nr:dehydrodolichyl diphosphate synthase complex subunit nus1 [Tanacetum cinerariifolium]
MARVCNVLLLFVHLNLLSKPLELAVLTHLLINGFKDRSLKRLAIKGIGPMGQKEDSKNAPLFSKKQMEFEFVSLIDGKEAVAKAANLLFKKYYADEDSEKPFFTETYLTEALRTLGHVEPDPDLLLIYGPARCHLGFPAWRIRYTEMV